MNVGNAIRRCRTRRGVSQSEVANRAKCSLSYLSMLENNKRDPTLSTVTRIAQALRIPVGGSFYWRRTIVIAGRMDQLLMLGALKPSVATNHRDWLPGARLRSQHGPQ